MNKIKKIVLSMIDGDTGYYSEYEIGKNDVTRITFLWYNDGHENGCYQIWKGDKLFCELYDYTEVFYDLGGK